MNHDLGFTGLLKPQSHYTLRGLRAIVKRCSEFFFQHKFSQQTHHVLQQTRSSC